MTINDIARLAGVSKSTVSRYLTGGSVSKKSAEKIARVIESTGYVLNASASKLRSQRSRLVGVLVDGIDARAVTRILRGINDRLHELDYLPFIVIDNHDEDHKLAGMQALVRQGVDAIIFGTAQLTDEHARFMLGADVPIIVLGQRSDAFPFAKVDDYAGGRLMAEHVIEQKPKHLVYLGFPGYDRAGLERWHGFVDACGSAGVGVEYLECGYEREAGYHLAEQALANGTDFIVGASDTICLGVLRYLGEHGMSAPKDVRLAGFGNYEEGSLPMVSLTSVGFDYLALGRDVARKAVDLIEGEDVPHESVDYPMEIHVRNSSLA
ncbi:transcriptional regulator, LacI family [Olsenella sp. KH1P3]|uniref:Transcriptional regulator, LacI family n=2 Tax=Coriobacteriales TaxID=84999 RepID=A0A1H9N0A0_9ACTN|nr:transcriptional regulator, LacI family [Parafannyhessea umbonata]SER29406.1 transcriptional regulator, LacI family [Parafannyhessea umbonata]SJZ38436.1 transcriptional regulator, LacI family [Olsenella sp. KH1P3]